MAWSKLSETEIVLARRWYIDNGEPISVIAERFGRDFSTMARLLVQRKKRKVQGRLQTLSSAKVDLLEKKVEARCGPVRSVVALTPWHLSPASHVRMRSSG